MRALWIIAPLLLAGCEESKFDKARERVVFLQQNKAPRSEVCEAKRAVAKAAIDERRGDEYQLSQIDADMACDRVKP